MLDPGFGFGKSTADNLRLIAEIPRLVALGSPVVIGVSRKSTIGELVGKGDDIAPPDQRLAGSLAVTGLAVTGGAAIVRTHDVTATFQFLSALDATMRTGGN
jgi:dihydropteroate synthase